ncbi:MAG: SAM-dependent chlorinase/fluorinase [Candidatus Aminicenantes bacterium]|nr:SAM-dependent chlorinase/fluorinase [Candidatus Aminicenantes bacterium]
MIIRVDYPIIALLTDFGETDFFVPSIKGVQKNELSAPHQTDDEIQGTVLYKDKFGNLITNIPSSQLDLFLKKHGREAIRLIARENIMAHGDFYSAVPIGDPVFLFGSLGLIEITVREGSAFNKLEMKPGDGIIIKKMKN